jgi:hypothetical protein
VSPESPDEPLVAAPPTDTAEPKTVGEFTDVGLLEAAPVRPVIPESPEMPMGTAVAVETASPVSP